MGIQILLPSILPFGVKPSFCNFRLSDDRSFLGTRESACEQRAYWSTGESQPPAPVLHPSGWTAGVSGFHGMRPAPRVSLAGSMCCPIRVHLQRECRDVSAHGPHLQLQRSFQQQQRQAVRSGGRSCPWEGTGVAVVPVGRTAQSEPCREAGGNQQPESFCLGLCRNSRERVTL